MEKNELDIIIGLLKENRDDIKQVLILLPTFQTKEACAKTIKDKADSKKTDWKYVLTSLIASIALVIALLSKFGVF